MESVGPPKTRLVFRVRSFHITRDGWRAGLSVTNDTATTFSIVDQNDVPDQTFGLMVFRTGSHAELEAAERASRAPRAARSDDVLARATHNARAARDVERDRLCRRSSSGGVLDPLRVRRLRAEREVAGGSRPRGRVRSPRLDHRPRAPVALTRGRPPGRAAYERTSAANAESPASREKSASTATAARRSGIERQSLRHVSEGCIRATVEALIAGQVVQNRRIVGEALVRRGEDGDSGAVPPRSVVGVGAAERVPAEMDPEQPRELCDRLRVIVHAQVADAVDALARLGRRSGALDDDGSRLLAPRVSPAACPAASAATRRSASVPTVAT